MHISLLYRVWSDETKLINHGRIILELLQIRPISIIQNNQDKDKGELKNQSQSSPRIAQEFQIVFRVHYFRRARWLKNLPNLTGLFSSYD